MKLTLFRLAFAIQVLLITYTTRKIIIIKIGGHQTNFLSGEQNLPLTPHIFRIIQYKTLWSVFSKKSVINNLKVLYLFHRF